ncbi:hypothetical protein CB1_000850021 [Camelus ferus]|nr:hypothetical protein CB1_000850021 [Camelus ferus]
MMEDKAVTEWYHCPMPKIFYVQLTVGNNEFFGEGKTRQAARHNAAMKALQALQNEPIPEKSAQNGESGKEMDDDKDANKSEISLVFEIALKRNMPVSFEVIKESGPPHMKSFVTRVSVGEFSAEGEGNSKKLSKKRAATTVLQELKKLPPLPVVEKPKLFFKKRPKTIVKAGPEYGQGMNPISRLAQIQQAKKEKEPDYVLLSERGMPRRREFVMQVKVGNEVATGTGPNKKIAKKNAAEAMLLQLGYKASTSLQDQLDKGVYAAGLQRYPCLLLCSQRRVRDPEVHYCDRQSGKECVTCLTLAPVQMTFHAIGSSIEASHDQIFNEGDNSHAEHKSNYETASPTRWQKWAVGERAQPGSYPLLCHLLLSDVPLKLSS